MIDVEVSKCWWRLEARRYPEELAVRNDALERDPVDVAVKEGAGDAVNVAEGAEVHGQQNADEQFHCCPEEE